jgi:hypothetical protein
VTDISENFRTFLLADSAIRSKVAGRVHAIKTPQAKLVLPPTPFIWFRKRSAQTDEQLAPDAGHAATDFAFDVECVATNNEQTAVEVAELVRTRCSCYRGSFGDTTAKGVFVNDQDDDYEAQSTGGDDRLAVSALDVRVIT